MILRLAIFKHVWIYGCVFVCIDVCLHVIMRVLMNGSDSPGFKAYFAKAMQSNGKAEESDMMIATVLSV